MERGGPRAAHYEAELAGPGCPPAAAYLWGWFQELHRARPAGGMGPGAIGYTEMEAWARLRRVTLAPWEVEVLGVLDQLWLAAQAKAVRGRGPTG